MPQALNTLCLTLVGRIPISHFPGEERKWAPQYESPKLEKCLREEGPFLNVSFPLGLMSAGDLDTNLSRLLSTSAALGWDVLPEQAS